MGFAVVVYKEENEKNKYDLKYLINYSSPHINLSPLKH